jgi:hypothetical protein
MEKHLRHEPTNRSKSRIKRLRGIRRPEYRLLVDEMRVFYDVADDTVEVLAIVKKSDASACSCSMANRSEPENEAPEERGESKR